LSIALRWSAFFSIPVLFHFTFLTNNFKNIFKPEAPFLILPFKASIFIIASLSLLLFICGVKSCENYAFFISAKGKKPKLRKAIKYFKFKTLPKTLLLHIKIFFLKFFWLAYYTLPSVICFAELFYMYKKSTLTSVMLIILCFSGSLLFSLCLFMYKATVFRYSAAPFYIILNHKTTVKHAISKSLEVTDSYIPNAVLLKASLVGWLISCFAILPVFYVLPYYKLCNALLLYRCVTRGNTASVKSNYAINYLKLEKNQESI
jgi:hypothetical protein